MLDVKQVDTLKLMLVANGKTERHSELPTSEFEFDFCIRHQHHFRWNGRDEKQ